LPVTAPADMNKLDIAMMDENLQTFCKQLSRIARLIHTRVKEALPEQAEEPHHNLPAGRLRVGETLHEENSFGTSVERTISGIVDHPNCCKV